MACSSPRVRRRQPFTAPRRVVVGISGAIAAVDAPALVRGLQAIGCEVRVAMTRPRGSWSRSPRCARSRTRRSRAACCTTCLRTSRSPSGPSSSSCGRRPRPRSPGSPAEIAPMSCPRSSPRRARRCDRAVDERQIYGSPAVQDNLDSLRSHGRWIVHPAFALDVVHRARRAQAELGSAAPPAAMFDLIRHVLAEAVPRPACRTTPRAGSDCGRDAGRAARVACRGGRSSARRRARGPVAPGNACSISAGRRACRIAAAKLGYRVTATEIAPTALGHARQRAGVCRSCSCSTMPTSSMLDGRSTSPSMSASCTACRVRHGSATRARSIAASRPVARCSSPRTCPAAISRPRR